MLRGAGGGGGGGNGPAPLYAAIHPCRRLPCLLLLLPYLLLLLPCPPPFRNTGAIMTFNVATSRKSCNHSYISSVRPYGASPVPVPPFPSLLPPFMPIALQKHLMSPPLPLPLSRPFLTLSLPLSLPPPINPLCHPYVLALTRSQTVHALEYPTLMPCPLIPYPTAPAPPCPSLLPSLALAASLSLRRSSSRRLSW